MINPENPRVSQENGEVRVQITVYAVSVLAIRETLGGPPVIEHAVFMGESHVVTEDQAREFGLAEARKKWRESEGWAYRFAIGQTMYTFDFGKDC